MSEILATHVEAWAALASHIEIIQAQPLGPSAPIPLETPNFIKTFCTQAYSRGKQAAKDVRITGPTIPNSACEDQIFMMNEYFSLGISSNSGSFSTPEKIHEGNKPSEFRGGQDNFKNFKTQLALWFGTYPQQYNSDKSKIKFAAGYLRGAAFDWLEPFVNQSNGEVEFATYSEFLSGLEAGFADPDSQATAEREIKGLKQTGSCSAYYSRFTALTSQLGWAQDSVKIMFFRDGLKPSIRAMLLGRDVPRNISDFAALCIKLDNEIHAWTRETKSHPTYRPITIPNFNHPPSFVGSSSPYQSPRPLQQLNPIQNTSPSQKSPSLQNTGLPPGEPMELDAAARKAYRKANNLCTYCGLEGHWVSSCPKLKSKEARVTISAALNNSTSEGEQEIIFESKNESS